MSVGADPQRAMQERRRGAPAPQTASVKEWANLNCTESRLSIGDDEIAFLENGMFLGKHIISVPLYNGPPGASLNPNSLVKESYGCALTYAPATPAGGTPSAPFPAPHPVTIAVFEDGSAYMRDHYLDGAVDTLIAPAGTFSASPGGTAIKIWQDGPVLILDDKNGYASWDGAKLVGIDSGKKGHALAVFEGHAWLILAPRSFTYSAPNSFSNFVAGDGAGSFKITDDAFVGAITTIYSTVEQLWILGASAIDALGNVATSGGVTTFAVTNAVTSLGTVYPDSVAGFFRSLTFFTGYSVHALLGVTPQEVSQKIRRLFALLGPAITFGPRIGVQELNGATVLCFLFRFTDPTTAATRSEILGFHEGKFFLARTPDLNGHQIVDLVTLTIHATPEVYGIDRAGRVYRIFARSADAPQGTLTVSSKLYDLGAPIQGHAATRVGLDLSAPLGTAIAPLSLTLVTESKSAAALTNEKFNVAVDSLLGLRYALYRRDAPIIGQRVGWTLTVPCAYRVTLEAAYLEHTPTGEGGWDVVDPAVIHLLWQNNVGVLLDWKNGAGVLVGGWLA